MVVIDEKDVGKTREQVLMDLIYEATNQRIPLDKVRFGLPLAADPRKDLATDPNTFIPCRVDQQYDDRYWAEGSGFLYRRRCIRNHSEAGDFKQVRPITLPFKITDVLPQINAVLPYPIQAEDVVNHEYTTLEQVYAGVTLEAHPTSLLWINKITFQVDTSALEGGSMITRTTLDGFHEYAAAG